MLYERRHTREIADFGGLARVVPALAAVFTVVALSSIGLPGLTDSLVSSWCSSGSFGAYPIATVIATTGVIFAAAYLLWALQRIIYQRLDKPENEKLPDLTAREWAVLVPLLVGIVWMGLYPRPVLDKMEPAAKRYIELSAPGASGGQVGRGRLGRLSGWAMNINLGNPLGLSLAMLPELAALPGRARRLAGGRVAQSHRRDVRLSGYMRIAGVVAAMAALGWLWDGHARPAIVAFMVAWTISGSPRARSSCSRPSSRCSSPCRTSSGSSCSGPSSTRWCFSRRPECSGSPVPTT
jgi:NADH:ubiquinone oxidoreductase subunit 5 (subunit L)/multisubunit Na+/H+ antiporter MnhA subunit